MRDGTRLATDVYLPTPDGAPFPTVYASGPYGKGGTSTKLLANYFCLHGYAFVSQDVCGRGKSEGRHAIIFHHSGWSKNRDGHDTIAWIASQPWSNGSLGTVGVSALGVTQNMQAVEAPKALKAHIPEVACSNLFAQSAYQGGVWRKSLMEGWLKQNKLDDVNLESFLAHSRYDDFWEELNPEAQAHRVNAPGLFIGGWYDIFVQGTINSYQSINQKGDSLAKGRCRLIIGPWAHGSFDELKYPDADYFSKVTLDERRRFLDFYVKGDKNGLADEPPVRYYVMGDPTDTAAPGNFWRIADDWPPRTQVVPWYFSSDGKLSEERSAGENQQLDFEYDPNNPVPTVGGQNLLLPKGPMDQRIIESRPDVLVFTSEKLAEPLEVTGQVLAKIYISSDSPDTDFTVKLCDVYPDGKSMLVTDGIRRARFRKSYETEELLEPGQVCEMTIDLWSTSLVFNQGHRIRVAVSSSNSPRFEPNPNTGKPFRADAETRAAKNTVYMSSRYPSHILLPVYAGSGSESSDLTSNR